MIAEKSFRIFPLRMFCEKQLVKILSISVAECAVTRVGLVISEIIMRKQSVQEFLCLLYVVHS